MMDILVPKRHMKNTRIIKYQFESWLKKAVKLFVLIFLIIDSPLVSFGQQEVAKDKYEKARAIISDLDSIVTPDGLQQSYMMNIGGVKQWVYVRGQDKSNPIILFIHGGPASPISSLAWSFQRPIEEYFTVVNYDQRASGRTYSANDTLTIGKTIHIQQYVEDAIQLAEFIRKKYAKKKIILMAHSWGTIIALKIAIKRPDLFYAYVGIGQVISTMENEMLSFDYGLEQAKRFKNEKAIKELQSIKPYPGNRPITRERIVIARTWPQYYGGLSAYRNNSNYFFNIPLLSPSYTVKDVAAIDSGSLYTLGKILPEFLNVDLRSVKIFPIPVFMLLGRHDYTTPTLPTEQWLKEVKAPIKKGIWFEHSAHLIPLEEPGKLLITLINNVRPLVVKK